MQVKVLVIEKGAEAVLVCAALARSEVHVVDAPDLGGALRRLDKQGEPVVLAIAGSAALAQSADELVKRLGARGIPVIGVTAGLAPDARRRALAAGVREIHDRPRAWRPYWELIGSLVARFTPAA